MALVSISFLTVGCSGANTQSSNRADNPATRSARFEEEFQNQADKNGEIRSEARQAVLDYIKTNLSTWNVKGMSCEEFNRNNFAIDADLEKDGQHVVLTLYTEKFFPESGDPYWVAIPVTRERLDRLHVQSDEDLLKQLEKARRAVEGLQ
jgi:hypothetical protein